MIFSQLSYRQKSRLVPLAFVALLMICWFFAFSKTFKLVVEYSDIEQDIGVNNWSSSSKNVLSQKLELQNKVLSRFTADSSQWTSDFLLNLGPIISDKKIGVDYKNKQVIESRLTVEREVMLSGEFNLLLNSLTKIEDQFFVKSLESFLDRGVLKFRINIAILKTA